MLASSLTLTQLAYVVALATHGHFGRAAEACHVSQPTLSAQLQKLERELGATLFDRSQTPIVPTAVGQLVVEQARVILREAARLLELRDAARGAVVGELRLGVLPTLAPSLLPRLLPALAERHPRLVLIVEEVTTDGIAPRLRAGALDAGLLATAVDAVDLDAQPLFTEPFVLYAADAHPLAHVESVTPDMLDPDDLWLLTEGHCFRGQVLQLCARRPAGGSRGVRFESGSLETLMRMVERTGGITLLPALAALDAMPGRGAAVRAFAAPAPAREVQLVRRRDALTAHLADALTAVVREVAQRELRLASQDQQANRRLARVS